jgi:hypothetical protein
MRAVARYFFDIHDGTYTRDEEGVELDDVDAAQMEVWNTLPMLAAHRKSNGNMACQLRMDVRDESGKHLFHAALALVIEPASNG